ncbi:uncharacterized protein LOC116845111 [Odontomachus brunneus]|uniref:uncharacterized protein LOC116845111 n=1 Tax=Odontomachus brunneus TaxID=486640 RepID=UPI0013F1F988|nr:uncharacterized protein LOC116845111 [Odontomachus brunneus]
METFVLLPFFLLSRVPSDADTWRHGPEYTFMANTNTTMLQGRSESYQMYNTLKCRPQNSDTLRCQFGAANLTLCKEEPEHFYDEHSWFNESFGIKFDRRGIQSLVIPRDTDSLLFDIVRAFISQMNFGVELLHKPDGAFNAKESSYLGQCDTLVNISHEAQGNEGSGEEDYEIVTVAGLQKKRGETLVIEKTKNLENCVDIRPYVMAADDRDIKMQMVSSRSRTEISDMGFNSYTENMVHFIRRGISFSFCEKINLNLVSVLPAKEALQPLSVTTTNVSPYVQSKKD